MDVYGLIGNPVGHSLSPPMHEAAYDALDLAARYVTLEPDPKRLDLAIRGADALGVAGLNVTIPFKERVLEHVSPDQLASRIGAVNTLDFAGDRVVGYNTDVAGVRRAFTHHDVSIAGREAVVIGAGGAGRAAAFALADAGATVAIANRTEARARRLADQLPEATGHGLEAVGTLLADADLLVNATSVGMEENVSPVPADSLHSELTVLDAVYTPLETKLLREADAVGATTIDGAWMLLYQGVEAFERWTDKAAPVQAMNRALRSHL